MQDFRGRMSGNAAVFEHRTAPPNHPADLEAA